MAFVPVYRFWNANAHDHFYTTNANETGPHAGYASEGQAFHLSTVGYPGFVPVYRYYLAAHNDHFYTTNASEIGVTQHGQVGNFGYVCEGLLGYIAQNQVPGSVPVYRYNHAANHDHFFTTNAGEIGVTGQGQTGNHGYQCEGVLGYAFSSAASGLTQPVYRYWKDANHDHFYTTKVNEIGTVQNGAVGNFGYKCEGVAFQVFTHALPGLVPVYRYWLEGSADHFYTANGAEIGVTQEGASGKFGYKCEGVLGYVSTTQFPGTVPVYRYYHDANHDHFYTHNVGEIGVAQEGATGNHGYRCEGVLGYAYP